jgi:two-component sensor histidine kinase
LWRRVLFGAGLALVAAGFRRLIDPYLPGGTVFVLFYPVVTAAAVFFGLGGGVTCLLVSAASGFFFFGQPRGVNTAPAEAIRMGLFVLANSALLWLVTALRTAVGRLQAVHAQQALLVEELQHRVKNILAVVQAIVMQSFSGRSEPREIQDALVDRLLAMSVAHDLLQESEWRPASLDHVAAKALEPFAPMREGRVRVDGEPVWVSADQVSSLVLCLHELATNATKYGALSTRDGTVDLCWRRVGDNAVRVEWREHGGPTVVPPARSGFGERLLRQGLGPAGPAASGVEYTPDGLRWRAELRA